VWDIKAVKKQLGHEICTHILFLHAPPGIGKGNSLNKFRSSKDFREQAKVSDVQSSSTCSRGTSIGQYGGKLDTSRYKRSCGKVVTNTSHVEAQTLLQQNITAFAYSSRYSSGGEELFPEEWGWRESDGETCRRLLMIYYG
jgi:hypothetical protein